MRAAASAAFRPTEEIAIKGPPTIPSPKKRISITKYRGVGSGAKTGKCLALLVWNAGRIDGHKLKK
jgi:hypothetical protein